MTTTTECPACHQPVARRDAVLRSVSLVQVAYHAGCFPSVRWAAGVDARRVEDAVIDTRVGMSLSERMELARSHRGY